MEISVLVIMYIYGEINFFPKLKILFRMSYEIRYLKKKMLTLLNY